MTSSISERLIDQSGPNSDMRSSNSLKVASVSARRFSTEQLAARAGLTTYRGTRDDS